MKSQPLYIFLFTFFLSTVFYGQVSYFEDFLEPGRPYTAPTNWYWKFKNHIYPKQNNWKKFIPGDGFAYITVDAHKKNDKDKSYPYQSLIFGKVAENHRIEVRMKGAVVDGGLVGFLFTYNEFGKKFNEVDIELVARDQKVKNHPTLPPNGWTDARFNTWQNANIYTYLPVSQSSKPIVNAYKEKVSHIDDKFHTYTIDWRADQVDFFIDGVWQESFTGFVAREKSEVIIGFRALPWAGKFKWKGKHQLVIDYLKIEPLKTLYHESKNVLNSLHFLYIYDDETDMLYLKENEFYKVKSIELQNIHKQKIMHLHIRKDKINLSSLPNGVYFLNLVFEDGSILQKKIVKR